VRGLTSRLPLLLLLVLPLDSAFPAEYQENEDIAAESAEESAAGLRNLSTALSRPRRRLLRDALSERSPFWEDSELELNLRLYDFERENGEEVISEALAIGTELTFRSGQWKDVLSAVLSWHTSNGIDAPDDKPGSGILGPEQEDISVISRAYLDAQVSDKTSLRLYRQDFNMPYINRNDNRMIPNTHEAYALHHEGGQFRYMLGHITKMKTKDSEDFVSMAEVAGAESDDSGTSVAFTGYKFDEHSGLGVLAHHTSNLFASSYIEATLGRTLNKNWGTQLAAQLTNQWSVGNEKLGDFDTYAGGLRGRISYQGTILTAAYTDIGSAAIQRPYGGTPGFSSSMLYQFDRAREEGYRLGLSHNFARIGYPGIGLIVNYTEGRDAQSTTGIPLPDAEEINITLDFRPERGLLKGLWLRLRYADADRGSPEADRRDLRLILNYSLGAL
jgi:outer membrane OprD family porin